MAAFTATVIVLGSIFGYFGLGILLAWILTPLYFREVHTRDEVDMLLSLTVLFWPVFQPVMATVYILGKHADRHDPEVQREREYKETLQRREELAEMERMKGNLGLHYPEPDVFIERRQGRR